MTDNAQYNADLRWLRQAADASGRVLKDARLIYAYEHKRARRLLAAGLIEPHWSRGYNLTVKGTKALESLA